PGSGRSAKGRRKWNDRGCACRAAGTWEVGPIMMAHAAAGAQPAGRTGGGKACRPWLSFKSGGQAALPRGKSVDVRDYPRSGYSRGWISAADDAKRVCRLKLAPAVRTCTTRPTMQIGWPSVALSTEEKLTFDSSTTVTPP